MFLHKYHSFSIDLEPLSNSVPARPLSDFEPVRLRALSGLVIPPYTGTVKNNKTFDSVRRQSTHCFSGDAATVAGEGAPRD
jgi:hypothetical protein